MSKNKGFNTPFDKLSKLKIAPPQKAAPNPMAAPRSKEVTTPRDDDAAFADAVLGAAPLPPDPRGRRGVQPEIPRPVRRGRVSDEAEAYAVLADLVSGEGAFDIADSDEYVEGCASGLDRRILKRLRRGDYALQGHVDLHGLRKEEAHAAVDAFIAESMKASKRCVLIVHGRGLNSKDQIPVLKERVRVWLTKGRIAKRVLAFSSALPTDGGTGAVYVLLRRD